MNRKNFITEKTPGLGGTMQIFLDIRISKGKRQQSIIHGKMRNGVTLSVYLPYSNSNPCVKSWGSR